MLWSKDKRRESKQVKFVVRKSTAAGTVGAKTLSLSLATVAEPTRYGNIDAAHLLWLDTCCYYLSLSLSLPRVYVIVSLSLELEHLFSL
jgi:hypothetical protein